MRASKSITRIEGGTNRISRTIFVADKGMPRFTALRSSPAGSGFLRLAFFSGSTAARAVMKAMRSRICTMPTGSSRVSL
jgi:hypothetical protein